MRLILIVFLLIGVAYAKSLDDEIVSDLDFAVGLQTIQNAPSGDVESWTELDLLEGDLIDNDDEIRSGP